MLNTASHEGSVTQTRRHRALAGTAVIDPQKENVLDVENWAPRALLGSQEAAAAVGGPGASSKS